MVDRDKQELENLRLQKEENDRKEKELEQREKQLFAENSRWANEIATQVIDRERNAPVIQLSVPSRRRKQKQRTDSESSMQSVSHQEFQSHFDFLSNQMLMMNQNFSAAVN